MRITSDLFVSALLRRVFAAGGYGAVLRKGAEQAGAIHIRRRDRLGLETLYGPAPQSFAMDDREDGAGDERLFEERLSGVDADAVDAALAREMRFDPDAWVVELECDDVAGLVALAGVERASTPADDLFRRR